MSVLEMPMEVKAGSLADRAVIVNLSISQWSARATDKKVNREVANMHGSVEEMGNYRKCLVAKEAIAAVSKIASAVRQEHYRLTLPWRDGGDRILSSAGYFGYAKMVRKFETEWTAAVQEFCANYAGYVQDARYKLNGLFNADDYPEESEIRKRFVYKYTVLPLPTADDFRVSLGEEETARIKSQLRADTDAQIARAMRDVWERMRDVISHLSERLKLYKVGEDGKVENTFRDTLVTNISDLLSILPTLNLTGDPQIAQFAAAMNDELTRYSPEELRESDVRRVDTAARADEILAKMSAFLA